MPTPNTGNYQYLDEVRHDILRMVPADGVVIGSIGCGWAATEHVLVTQGRQVHGADIEPSLVVPVGARLTSMRCIGLNELQPFEPASLDGLILADVLEHLPNAWERLRHYAQMVKPGGWVVVSVPNMRYLGALWQLGVRGDWPEHPLGIFDQTHIQVMTHKRLQRWALEAGLQLDHWHHTYDYRFVPRNIYRVLDWLTLRQLHSLFGSAVQGVFRKQG